MFQTNKERFESFLDTIPKLKNVSHESTHWGPAIKAFTLHQMRGDDGRGYHVSESEFGFRTPSIFSDIQDFIRVFFVRIARRMTLRMSDSRGRRYEHARAIEFLERHGLYTEYKAFIRRFHIGSDMQTARHYYYARVLGDTLKNVDGHNNTFLEIGAGAGNFAVFCDALFAPKRYIIIDLPEMLAYSAYQLLTFAPHRDIVYPEEYMRDGLKKTDTPTTYLLTPECAKTLPNDSADVILNFTSLSEMDKQEVERYFKEAYRFGRDGAVFYNVNRMKPMKDSGGVFYNNNPFLFPYHHTDSVVHFAPDAFHHETRGGIGTIPTLTVSYLARIRK